MFKLRSYQIKYEQIGFQIDDQDQFMYVNADYTSCYGAGLALKYVVLQNLLGLFYE